MDIDRLARLTEQQRLCLRHVYAHRTSKEIARLLGINPNSVDQHIKAATRILGVTERRDAATMLADYERRQAGGPFIATAPQSVAMREEQSAFDAAAPSRSRAFRVPIPIRGTRPRDFSALQRLGWIVAIMLMTALAFGVFLAGLEALSRFDRAG
jgi:DNA-binding CsgD family transcriptional regulator